MKVLLSCVNSAVSLVGFDLTQGRPFWYCPGNVLRTCGICVKDHALWVASDNTLTKIDSDGVEPLALPGPHENLAHSVKVLGDNVLGVADTGNSRILMLADRTQSGGAISYAPLEGWPFSLPLDAIHLNDFIPWNDGVLASAFAHQPFHHFKNSKVSWNRAGLGVIFYIRRKDKRSITSVAASGLNCPHSLCLHNEKLYCCSSSTGDFYCLAPASNGTFYLEQAWHVTDTHFLRGCLRVAGGWLLGGSTKRHVKEAADGGMSLFRLDDNGDIQAYLVAGVGEIYDILPWPEQIMPAVARQLAKLPLLPLEGEFPAPCDNSLVQA